MPVADMRKRRRAWETIPQYSSHVFLVRVDNDEQNVGDAQVVVIGVAADSGCGKSTFMRRLTSIFGGDTVGPLGGGFDSGGWETNTLVSDLTTVICLDDYHLNDRQGRKVKHAKHSFYLEG